MVLARDPVLHRLAGVGCILEIYIVRGVVAACDPGFERFGFGNAVNETEACGKDGDVGWVRVAGRVDSGLSGGF